MMQHTSSKLQHRHERQLDTARQDGTWPTLGRTVGTAVDHGLSTGNYMLEVDCRDRTQTPAPESGIGVCRNPARANLKSP